MGFNRLPVPQDFAASWIMLTEEEGASLFSSSSAKMQVYTSVVAILEKLKAPPRSVLNVAIIQSFMV